LTGDDPFPQPPCPYANIGCRYCVWCRRGTVCELLAILKP